MKRQPPRPARRDPYGNEIQVNGRHVRDEDFDDEPVKVLPEDTDEELARRIRGREFDRFAARYGLPGLIALAVVMKVLGIEL